MGGDHPRKGGDILIWPLFPRTFIDAGELEPEIAAIHQLQKNSHFRTVRFDALEELAVVIEHPA
ncbi:hypothetical protein D3C72_1145500 [compost metagenome]